MKNIQPMMTNTQATGQSDRLYYLDWLRVFAILVVFLYHSTRFFNLGDWHIKNITTYVWVEIWNIFSMTWLMPLFFIISGASLFYAIGRSGGFSKFYSNKFMRLMVPVLVAAVTHSALQIYLERLSHGQFTGSFFSFIPEYFDDLYFGIGVNEGNFSFFGMHLWYLVFLFVDSLICYRLFTWFKGSGRGTLNRITALLCTPGLMYIWFSVPLIIMYALIPPAVLNAGAGAWGFLYYLWFLISGFMIVSNEKLKQNIIHQRWISLSMGVVLSAIFIYHRFNPSFMVLIPSTGHWIYKCIYFFSAWCWLFAILGFSMRFLAFDRPFLRNANEGVLPFYILHQPVLVCIGFFVVTWKIHAFLKWAIILTCSFTIILTLYLFFVRRFNLFRFLFGMKTTRPFFDIFRKKGPLGIIHALYIGLIIFATSGASVDRSPMPLTYDPVKDIVLNSESISSKSSTGVQVIADDKTSIGQAIEFSAGAN
ncbi:MAG: acyltransferase family protein, partial [Deltaproteobacteria bacterium]|nr:acyltransferase family protein [Deltaproteobacteria bacterium]